MLPIIILRNNVNSLFRRNIFDDTKTALHSLRYLCSRTDDNDNLPARPPRRTPIRALKKQKHESKNTGIEDIMIDSSELKQNVKNENIEKLLDNMMTGVGQQDPDLEQFPSDLEEYNRWKATQADQKARTRIDPETTSIALFPGQGSQFVGMGKRLLMFEGVKELYDHASEILNYDLLKLCLSGPKSELDKTIHCQPAVFVTSVAAIEKMKEENFQGIQTTVAAAGFSVGEFAAMVFAQMMSFEDALQIVKIRAEEMQKASDATPGGMLTVFCYYGTDLKLAMNAAKEYCITKHNIQNPVCQVANYLYQETCVIAGHQEALTFIEQHYKDFGIRRVVRIPVSGAFHTELMMPAKQPFIRALKSIRVESPKLKVFSNVDASSIRVNDQFAKNMCNQIVKPVKWEQIMYKLYMRDRQEKHPFTYECGPGNQLGTFLRKLNNKAYKNYRQIEV